MLVVLAVIFAIVGILYALGAIQFLTSTSAPHHYKHALASFALAVVCLVGANFARRQPA